MPVASGLPSSNEAVVSVARSVRANYLKLVRRLTDDAFTAGSSEAQVGGLKNNDETDAGPMLLLAFDTLFNNVDSALQELRLAVNDYSIPEEWADGIDVAAQARQLTGETGAPDLYELLDLTTFMNR